MGKRREGWKNGERWEKGGEKMRETRDKGKKGEKGEREWERERRKGVGEDYPLSSHS